MKGINVPQVTPQISGRWISCDWTPSVFPWPMPQHHTAFGTSWLPEGDLLVNLTTSLAGV